MSGVKVSVIIPVYNRGNMLKDSILSVQNQTLRDIEIICIDDGSTDDTISIIESLRLHEPRIKLLHQQNSGPGAARNLGLKYACGKYISFLDSDDTYMDAYALQYMYEACENRKVNVCGARFGWMKDGVFRENTYFTDFDVDMPDEGRWVSFSEYQFDVGFWSFIYSRKFLIDRGIEFPAYRQYEDPVFFVSVMVSEGGFWFLPIHLLNVRVWSHDVNARFNNSIKDTLGGIFRNLKVAAEAGYELLYKHLLERIENARFSILECMSFELLKRLVEIEDFNRKFGFKTEFTLMSDLIKVLQSLSLTRDSSPQYIPIELKGQLERVGTDAIRNFFETENIQNIGMYGAGMYGNALYLLFKEIGLKVKFIMDQKIKEFDGYMTLEPDAEIPICDAVVVTPMYYDEIEKKLQSRTNIRIISFCRVLDELERKQSYGK